MNYINILITLFLIVFILLVLKSLCNKENFNTTEYNIKLPETTTLPLWSHENIFKKVKELINNNNDQITDDMINAEITKQIKYLNNRVFDHNVDIITQDIVMVLEQHNEHIYDDKDGNYKTMNIDNLLKDMYLSMYPENNNVKQSNKKKGDDYIDPKYDKFKQNILELSPKDLKEQNLNDNSINKEFIDHYTIIYNHLKIEKLKNNDKTPADWRQYKKSHPKNDLDEWFTDIFKEDKEDDNKYIPYKGLDNIFKNKGHDLGVDSYDNTSDEECPKGEKCWTGISKEALKFKQLLKKIEDKYHNVKNTDVKTLLATPIETESNKWKSKLEKVQNEQTIAINRLIKLLSKNKNNNKDNKDNIKTTASVYINTNTVEHTESLPTSIME